MHNAPLHRLTGVGEVGALAAAAWAYAAFGHDAPRLMRALLARALAVANEAEPQALARLAWAAALAWPTNQVCWLLSTVLC
jgi:hypothetical protein